MKKIFFFIYLVSGFCAEYSAQNFSQFSVQNAHSHNDYQQQIPFWSAYTAGFGSMEADVILKNGNLYVAHQDKEISEDRTLQALYLDPLMMVLKRNNGYIYPDHTKKLTLLIEMKSDFKTELPLVAKLLQSKYPQIITNPGIKIIITGNLSQPSEFSKYPDFLYFDGDLTKSYTTEQLKRIGFFSSSLQLYTKWSGKGIMRDEESAKVRGAVQQAHSLGKQMRFWGAPDFPNAWVNLIDAGADIINTDHIPELASFLNNLPKTYHKNENKFAQYFPTYKSDGAKKLAKNIILLIPDGVSLPQYYAAYTANKGNLNIFRMRRTGLSNTNSANAYITDSAPGSTAFSTGMKTKNNYVGVDPDGKRLIQIPEIIAKKGLTSALMTTGDVTDATPADFYAHTDNRDNSEAILADFFNSKVSVLAGSPGGFNEKNKSLALINNVSISNSAAAADFSKDRLLILDPLAEKNYNNRGRWLGDTFSKILAKCQKNKKGFFIMVEGSRTDINAHANQLGNEVQELLDFDEVVGKALKFADEDGETLVIVVGDHETGGLSLLDGDIRQGWVLGNFSTNDHTSLPSMVFAYGPNSHEFVGFQENTDIFIKILKAFGIQR